jgi:hypothetical protein
MSLLCRTFYVPASAADAFGECKLLLCHPETSTTENDFSLLDEKPDQELHWLSRWGIALIDGRANFIPAHGGCVVYVTINSIGAFSRLALSVGAPLAGGPGRHLNAFHQLSRRYG